MLDGWEWLIVGVIAIVIILWGPAKIPEFAKALGRAKGEFQKAQDEFTRAASETSTAPTAGSTSTPAAATASTATFAYPPPPPPLRNKDEVLIDTARSLGISTEGKTREQISQEITFKIKLLNAD